MGAGCGVGKAFPMGGFERLRAPFCCCSIGILQRALSYVGGRTNGCGGFYIRCTIGTGTGRGILAVVHRDNLKTSYMDNKRVHTTVGTKFPAGGVICTNMNGAS